MGICIALGVAEEVDLERKPCARWGRSLMKRRYGASRFLLHHHHYNMQADIANNPQTLDDGNVRMEKNGTYRTSDFILRGRLARAELVKFMCGSATGNVADFIYYLKRARRLLYSVEV